MLKKKQKPYFKPHQIKIFLIPFEMLQMQIEKSQPKQILHKVQKPVNDVIHMRYQKVSW